MLATMLPGSPEARRREFPSGREEVKPWSGLLWRVGRLGTRRGKVVVLELHEEGGVGLEWALELLGLPAELPSVDLQRRGHRIARDRVVGVQFDVAADSRRHVDGPAS